MDFTFAQPIDRVLINVPSFRASNRITAPETYLECLTKPRLGASTGAICAGSWWLCYATFWILEVM